jgi:hypothetical protein
MNTVPMPVMLRTKHDRVFVFAIFVWIAVAVAGASVLYRYEGAPGVLASAPTLWPATSTIPRNSGLPIILVFAHPHCPCTRATIGELSLLMTQLHRKATATVVFARPDNTSKTWAETDLWQAATIIPGVTVISDPENREADTFGVQASGQTLVYDDQGRLQFNGGITVARGHSGDNVGRSSIIALVTKQGTAERQTSVFGCDLHTPIRRNQWKGLLP